MSRFYAVELKTVAIVQVGDEQGPFYAQTVADAEQSDILSDARHVSLEINSIGEVKSLSELQQYGWDGFCIPYGGDGNTRLEDLLPGDPQ